MTSDAPSINPLTGEVCQPEVSPKRNTKRKGMPADGIMKNAPMRWLQDPCQGLSKPQKSSEDQSKHVETPSESILEEGRPSNVDGGAANADDDIVMVSPLYPECYQVRGEDELMSSGEELREPNDWNPKVQVAPMLAVTNRHFRYLCRLLSRRTQMWTEMVVDSTLNNAAYVHEHLEFQPSERPIVCQIGGSIISQIGCASRLAGEWGRDWLNSEEANSVKADWTDSRPSSIDCIQNFLTPQGVLSGKSIYDEVNINCGCPSDKVSGKGGFGCFLMKNPDLVAQLTQRMIRSTAGKVPVTVKCRIGVDDKDSIEDLYNFVDIVSTKGGVRHFIVHARKAWLSGVNPKQNRTLPKLKHSRVFALVQRFPHLRFTVNGGINDLDEVESLLTQDFADYQFDDEPCEADSNAAKYAAYQASLAEMNNGSAEKVIGTAEGAMKAGSSNGLAMEGDHRGLKRSKEWVDMDKIETPTQQSPEMSTDEALLRVPVAIGLAEESPSLELTKKDVSKATSQKNLEPRYSLFGAMLGRSVMNNPCLLARADTQIYREPSDPVSASTRRTLLTAYGEYLALEAPTKQSTRRTFPLLKPTMGVLYGLPGMKVFRRAVDSGCRQPDWSAQKVLIEAVAVIDKLFPGILDYRIGDEPSGVEIKAHIRMKLGTWSVNGPPPKKAKISDDENTPKTEAPSAIDE